MIDDFSNDFCLEKWIPEPGEQRVIVISMELKYSKKGNPMYVVKLTSERFREDTISIYLTNISGKRWLLKQLVEAAGIIPFKSPDGKITHNWEPKNIIGKTVCAEFYHEERPWINKKGENILIKDAKVKRFYPAEEIPENMFDLPK